MKTSFYITSYVNVVLEVHVSFRLKKASGAETFPAETWEMPSCVHLRYRL